MCDEVGAVGDHWISQIALRGSEGFWSTVNTARRRHYVDEAAEVNVGLVRWFDDT